MKKITICCLASLSIVAGNSFADTQPRKCKTIHWQPDTVYSVPVSRELGLHIMLPAQLGAKPVPMNKDLWDTSGAGDHIFVKPNSTHKEGEQTTLTAVDTHNNSYTFILIRESSNAAEVCVRVNPDDKLLDSESRASLTDLSRPPVVFGGPEKDALLSQIADLESSTQKEVDRALDSYRGKIFTGYEWSSEKLPNRVQDVFDDGRFTYVRLDQHPIGAMAILGNVAQREEVLDFSFDAPNNIYRVSGIYEGLTLKYDEAQVVITRVN